MRFVTAALASSFRPRGQERAPKSAPQHVQTVSINIMKHCVIIILIIFQTSLLAQWSSVSSIYLDQNVYNQIVKNIQLSDFSKYQDQDLKPQHLIDKMTFCDIEPDILIKKSNILYPDRNFTLFEVIRDGDISIDRNTKYEKTPKEITSQYYIVGIDSSLKNGDLDKVKFISDNFIANNIYVDFDFDQKTPDSYIEFIKLKKYYYKLDNVEFKSKNRKYFFFKATSLTLDKRMIIRMDRKTFGIKLE